MARWELVITGCGTSHGNPPWGWPALWSDDPRDARRRSGAMLQGPAGEIVLIDAGPDLMHQLRDPWRDWDGRSYPARCVVRCDALLLTHVHADHCHGINELRHLNRLMQGGSIPIYGHPEHLAALEAMFPYCFGKADDIYRMGAPSLASRAVEHGQAVAIAGARVLPVELDHGPAGRTTGFRCGAMAYLTDLKSLSPASRAYLRGLDLLALDMLRDQPHPTHLCWAEAEAIIADLAPARTVLTHLGHEVRYAQWRDRLPPSIELAYDGWHASFEA